MLRRIPMSAEDDLKRLRQNQDRMFEQLEEKVRRSQELISSNELAEKLHNIGLRLEQINGLTPQLVKLGRLAGMSETAAGFWADSLIRDAKRKLPKAPG
jgi:hypothetical protein